VKFRRYASITGSTSTLIMEQFLHEGWLDNKHTWVATEKVHGANFSFCTDGETITCAKRTSQLSPGEKFHDWELLLETEKPKILHLFKSVQSTNPSTVITIFGEILGGIYPHKDVPKDLNVTVHVQKGVYYFPEIKFYAFDIWASGHSFLPYDDFARYCSEAGFLYAEPLLRGTFTELMEFPVDTHITTLPTKFGLPPLDNNIAEGIVIKPVTGGWTAKGSRVILKIKSENFKEVCGMNNAGKKTFHEPKEATPLPENLSNHCEQLKCYVTENRLRNVLSKIGEVKSSDRGKLVGLLAKDSLKEYQEDTPSFGELIREEQKVITGRLNNYATQVVYEHFPDILRNEF